MYGAVVIFTMCAIQRILHTHIQVAGALYWLTVTSTVVLVDASPVQLC